MLQRKAHKNIKILLKKKKSKNINIHTMYIIILLKQKKTKGMNICLKNIETFPKKKKAKRINMLANDIEIFFKNFNLLCEYKNYFHSEKLQSFSGKHERVSQELGKQIKLVLCLKIQDIFGAQKYNKFFLAKIF